MAISAKFIADFEAFVASTRNAEASLKSLEGGTARLGTSFESMKGLALNLASAFGVTFSIGAVVSFGRELLRAADELTKLHDKTGISIEGLQRFQVAGDDAGNTIDEISNAIVKLSDKLVSGDKSAVGALEKLGLTFADLKGLSPEQQFIAISNAIRQIEDPALQVNIAMDLFGRQGAAILPVLKRGFDDLKDATVGMSRESVRALDNFGDALDRWWRAAKGIGGEAIGVMIRGITDPAQYGEMARALEGATTAAEQAAPKIAGLAVPGLPEDLAEIEAALKADAAAIEQNTKALEPFLAAMEELNAAGMSWQETVDTIDGSVVEAIKDYLKAGVAQKDLATAYGLTAAQIKAVASAMEAEKIGLGAVKTTTDATAKSARDMGAAFVAAHEQAAAAAKKHTDEHAQQKAAADAIAAAANRAQGGSTEYDLTTAAGRAKVPPDIAMYLHNGYSFEQAARLAYAMKMGFDVSRDPLFRIKGPRVPGFKEGGPTTEGPAMLHGNEYVVPEKGALVMRGGGGSTLTVNMHVSGVLDPRTIDQISKGVKDEIMRAVKSSRQFGSA